MQTTHFVRSNRSGNGEAMPKYHVWWIALMVLVALCAIPAKA